MAASMLKNLGSIKILRICRITDFYRSFLSDAYKCDQLWKERLKSPFLEKIDPRPLGIDLLKNFDETKSLHSVDVDLFVNKIQDLPPQYKYLIKEILHRFRHCNTSVPVQDQIVHGIVRGLIEINNLEVLMEMLPDKFKYGIFPDDHSMCMLLDLCISRKDYKSAAQLAYDVMLQEEYDNQTRILLALTAAIKHFCHTMDFERSEQEDPSEDIEYIAVKVIRNPYYDDHFDIKDERFLLGKTLFSLSRSTPALDGTLSRSLQLIGLGLYEKFEQANQLLEEWISNEELEHVVCSEAVDHYKEYLTSAHTRDPDAEPRSMGEKTIDDEIELLKLTPESKGNCLTKLEFLMSSVSEERLPSVNIEAQIDAFMSSKQFMKYEQEDIKTLTEYYKQWMESRDRSVTQYLEENRRHEKEAEIQEKLAALQEREELLSYFQHREDIEDLVKNRPKEVSTKDKDVEEYVEVPGERNKQKKRVVKLNRNKLRELRKYGIKLKDIGNKWE